MRARSAIVLVALLAGCGGADPCAEFMGQTCLALHLSGKIDGESVDEIVLDVQTASSYSSVYRRTAMPPDGMPHGLPLAVGIVWAPTLAPTTRAPMVVVKRNGTAVGWGRGYLLNDIVAGHASTLDVKLTEAHLSTCFDGIRDSGESDVDCGGSDCPACKRGQSCEGGGACVESSCTYVSGSSIFQCQ